MKAWRNMPNISHLMFADDLLLFGKATVRKMKKAREMLDTFCGISGQKISYHKLGILFSYSTDSINRKELTRVAGIKETKQLWLYLGVSTSGKYSKVKDFQHIIDNIKSKLSIWKGSHLSMGRKVILTKSILEAIPTYSMMSNRMPRGSLKEIHKAQRQFIWGNLDGMKHLYTIKWSNLPKLKKGWGSRFEKPKHNEQNMLRKALLEIL